MAMDAIEQLFVLTGPYFLALCPSPILTYDRRAKGVGKAPFAKMTVRAGPKARILNTYDKTVPPKKAAPRGSFLDGHDFESRLVEVELSCFGTEARGCRAAGDVKRIVHGLSATSRDA